MWASLALSLVLLVLLGERSGSGGGPRGGTGPRQGTQSSPWRGHGVRAERWFLPRLQSECSRVCGEATQREVSQWRLHTEESESEAA